MEYTSCPLYNLQSKKLLKHLLGINDNNLLKQSYVAGLISPYIDHSSKSRLIEPPKYNLKVIQRRIKKLLSKIIVPNNVFSGIKGRSYVENAKHHIGENRRKVFKIDLTAFFPSISRDIVFQFFKNELMCSSDVAAILTNLTTVDIDKANTKNKDEIYSFLESKNINCNNHLISGAPTSQILSYLVNHKMFDEMQDLANKNNIVMTVYVDDVTFSSESNISRRFKEQIYKTIKKYHYQISKRKVKTYTRAYPKLVTGVIIDSQGKLRIKNSLGLKITKEHEYLRKHPNDNKSLQRLKGLLTAARQIDEDAFSTIYRYAFRKNV